MLLFLKKYDCLVPMGHVGTGKYGEKRVVITANDAVEAMDIASKIAGVKKHGSLTRYFLSIKEIEEENTDKEV